MLKMKNLHANAANNEILGGIDLAVNAGEVHAIMGANGSGKGTLAHLRSYCPCPVCGGMAIIVALKEKIS